MRIKYEEHGFGAIHDDELSQPLELSKRLEDWKSEWSKIIQIKKTVRKTGSYTLTIMIAREFNDKTVEILNALKELIEK
jgi:hypothetical protein